MYVRTVRNIKAWWDRFNCPNYQFPNVSLRLGNVGDMVRFQRAHLGFASCEYKIILLY